MEIKRDIYLDRLIRREKNGRNSFKKIIVVRDNIKVRRNDMGIVTIGIRNFLLDENSLNL